ncbi:MAG: hypothetical protein LBU48_00165 [Coriobacteriales bacterium]|jgi:hypothetical protein|nr:hypothetical protein [Coriobacteriales bacterium]
MNKRNLLTALGIVLSLLIAGGGWLLTSTLINRESDALLSATVITPLDVLAATPAGEQNDAPAAADGTKPLEERPRLSPAEINAILSYWNLANEERLHEPFGTQLSMEQAIEAAQTGLSSLAKQGALPAALLETPFEKPFAYLAQKFGAPAEAASRTPKPEMLDPSYSYWTVTLTNEDMGAFLVINAVTGQIWLADIDVYSANIEFGALDVESVLGHFVSYLGMESTEKIGVSQEGNYAFAYMNLAGGELNLSVDMNATDTDAGAVLSQIAIMLEPAGRTTTLIQ